jgi:uncharacterized repeat protein (TIGR03803 family)
MKQTRVASALLIVSLCTLFAQTQQTKPRFATLVSFDGENGEGPFMEDLVQGVDGNLWGTTTYGGASDLGVVFNVTLSGTVTVVHSFDGTDGENPFAGLVLGVDGNFYGTTYQGGANGYGTVFQITPSGRLTTLHNFAGTDGSFPTCTLIQGPDGNFYGTTEYGGMGACPYNCGTVFKITSSGTLTTLVDFAGANGYGPVAALVQGTDGNFYGTTEQGGTSGLGTVFKVTPAGALTTLVSFDDTNGRQPEGQLVELASGNFYGTTLRGGADGDGEVFMVTPSGTLTTYPFDITDGYEPNDGLVLATNGNFYGTTFAGGTGDGNVGTVFEINSSGELTSLHSFSGSEEGNYPYGGLLEHTSGVFYGVLGAGGTSNACIGGCGAIFSMNAGLGAFVKLLPASGKVGAAVTILGTNLTGATRVSFNGTAAKFKVVSNSEISTTVPTGATTGTVEVPIPSQSAAISTCSWASDTATCTVASAARFGTGYPLTIAGVIPSGYNVTGVLIIGINGNHISYALASNPGAYSSGGTASESSVTLVNNVVFRVTPQIKSFNPPSGPVGTVVTITGVSLTQTLGVGFGDYVLGKDLKIISDTEVMATVPPGAKTGPVGIETKGGVAIDPNTFTVTP